MQGPEETPLLYLFSPSRSQVLFLHRMGCRIALLSHFGTSPMPTGFLHFFPHPIPFALSITSLNSHFLPLSPFSSCVFLQHLCPASYALNHILFIAVTKKENNFFYSFQKRTR